MFIVGDKIVYPMHGAGIIEKVEEKKILGETRKYYILKVPCGDMQIMIPVDSSEDIGIRSIISNEELDEVVSVLEAVADEMSSNWNRRYRENMDRLKTGNAIEVAGVVKNLTRMDREKKLSTGEKKMLSNARQILTSEIVLVKDIGVVEAEEIINRAV